MKKRLRRKTRAGRITSSKPDQIHSGAAAFQVWRHRSGILQPPQADSLAREEPLEIRVRGRSVAVTMRTPGHDRELAAGFLLSEGIIQRCEQVVEIAPCLEGATPENIINVFLAPSVEIDFGQLTRHVFASSSCGLCGKASIEAVHQHFPPVESDVAIRAGVVASLPERMREAQRTFAQTGGLHAAAIFDAKGKLLVLREDVGRHNAVDKVIGYGLLEDKLPFDAHLLLVSGRASFEIMQKALAARIPIVCAISAPSSLAVDFARESGQTLIGFLRGETMNIYSSPERVEGRSKKPVQKGR
ncbi:MAG: FdhD protein [Verrucomicrobiota bacterium]